MIKLKGDNAYFIVPTQNRYGLSTNQTYDLTERDFSILVEVKVDWDKMVADTPTNEGGIISKNGQHCGLNAIKLSDGHTYIKATWWITPDQGGPAVYKDLWFDVKSNSKYLKVAMTHHKETKTMTLWVDGGSFNTTYPGEIIDYRDSWMWIGANNSLDNCAEEHRGFFFGEINHVSLHDIPLDDDQIRKAFDIESTEDLDNDDFQTAAAFSFKEKYMTPYKVFDISSNGNHMILFDKKWMDEDKELI